jgi:hypothetical protein
MVQRSDCRWGRFALLSLTLVDGIWASCAQVDARGNTACARLRRAKRVRISRLFALGRSASQVRGMSDGNDSVLNFQAN